MRHVHIQLANHDMIVLTSDFNQPQTNWEDPSSSFLSSNSRCLMDMAHTHNIKQRSFIKNSRNVTVDLIFSSDHESLVELAAENLAFLEHCHPPLSIELLSQALLMSLSLTWNVATYVMYTTGLPIRLTLRPVVEAHKVDESFTTFCHELRMVVEENCPLKRFGARKSFPAGFHWN